MKIVMACGGSGGHIFPALSVAQELEERIPNLRLIYVCGKKDIEHTIFQKLTHQKIVPIESAPYQGSKSLFNPFFLLKLASGFFRTLALLWKEKPDLVVGFGGYYSFPTVLAAKVLGQKTLLHEQNVFPGRANRVLSRWTDAVALSFSESKQYFSGQSVFRVTGNPIRASIEKTSRAEALNFFNFSAGRSTLLVLGGSQGAESLNTLFLEALKYFSEDFKAGIQVLHLCGRLAPTFAESACREHKVLSKAYSFFDRMDLVYSVTDFALARAGATFLSEISTKGIPALLVPYPYGDGHQRKNAAVFSQTHQATVVEQRDLTPEKLAIFLSQGMSKQRTRREVVVDKGMSIPNARQILADFIQEIAK